MPGHFAGQGQGYGLASIYRQRNPYDRNIQTTAAILPKSGYAAPFLAYVMGRDTVAANEWDVERSQKIGEAMKANALSEADEQKVKYLKEFIDIAQKTPATTEGKAFIKEIWEKDYKRRVGTDLNIDNIQGADDGKIYTLDNGEPLYAGIQGIKVIDQETGGWKVPTKEDSQRVFLKPAKAPTTREVQRDNQNITEEWDPKSGTWKKVGEGPKWEGKNKEGSVEDIDKEFRQWTGALDSLYGRKASIQKGFDPITGAVIPQTQIADALRSVDPQITQAETYMAEKFPQQWGIYKSTKGRLIHPVDAGTVNPGVFKSPDRIVAPPTASPAGKSSTSGIGEKTGIKYLEREAVLDMLGAGYRVKQDKDGRKYVYDKKGNKVGETK